MAMQHATDRLRWWREARFGMFIHYGLYSIPGRGEWIHYQEHIPNDEYARLADVFEPKHYNPREWVDIAQNAGMKYMVFTTRHHDGFCLFDSQVSDFTAPKTAARRDLIAEYAEACHRAGMRMGLYYSLEDWRFPGQLPHSLTKEAASYEPAVYEPMVAQAHAQVRELCSNYGTVDLLWYDGGFPPHIWRPQELNAMVRSLQPDILINDRSGTPEDYGTPENVVIAQQRPWEACYTMNDSWGYASGDHNYKSPGNLLRLLASCVAQDGNFLLNVGPEADGRFPSEATTILNTLGRWMSVNGEAVYGAGRSPVVAPAMGWSTRAGDKVYLWIQRWPGSTLPFAWCGAPVQSAHILATGDELRIEQRGDRVWLHGLPEHAPDPEMTLIVLTFEGVPRMHEPAYA